jgi:hypothetical protein
MVALRHEIVLRLKPGSPRGLRRTGRESLAPLRVSNSVRQSGLDRTNVCLPLQEFILAKNARGRYSCLLLRKKSQPR